MAFNHQQYNTQYLLHARDNEEPLNQAAHPYGVRIVPADVAEGETYWRCIGIHHLLPRENFSNHHVYLEVLDEKGQRIGRPFAWAGWTWEGRRPHERADPLPLDKPTFESAGNVSMHFGQVVSVWIKGRRPNANEKSDRVQNLHTAHPDEATPDGSLLNTVGHHSFYVVFKRTKKGVVFNDGLIRGRIERGQGQRIRLLKGGEKVAEQLIGSDLAFAFQGLGTGVYQLAVVDTAISQGNIRLDLQHKEVIINLAMPIPDDSLIFGRVENAAGKALLLIKAGNILNRLTIPLSGQYRFENLAEGVYTLQIFDTNIRQGNIVLDGTNSREINLVVPDVPVSTTGKKLTHYLLLGPPDSRGRAVNLMVALEYILAFSVTVGFSLEEAKQARQVTIIGAGIGPAEKQALVDSGSQVEQLAGDAYDIAAQLKARINSGQAFGG